MLRKVLHFVEQTDTTYNLQGRMDSAEVVTNSKACEWSRENQDLPTMYRWTVDYITYEGLFTELWMKPWFQNGIKSFGLLAIEREGAIRFCRSDTAKLLAVLPDGAILGVEEFLSGESLAIRHDPSFADLCWDPVDAVSHVLDEYRREDSDSGFGGFGVDS